MTTRYGSIGCNHLLCSWKDKFGASVFDNHLNFLVETVYRAKVLRTGEMSSGTGVFGWRAWRQPSTNFLVPPKLGYSVRTLRPHTCLILPFVHNRISHEKRFSRLRGSKGFTRGKRIDTQKRNDYACKKNDNRARYEGWTKPFPKLPQNWKCERHEKALLWQ